MCQVLSATDQEEYLQLWEILPWLETLPSHDEIRHKKDLVQALLNATVRDIVISHSGHGDV